MKIRRVKPLDLEPVIALGKVIHTKGERAHLAFDDEGAKRLIAECATRETCCAFVAEVCGEIVGVLLGCEQRWPYLKGRFASDLVLMATYPGAGKKLLAELVKWGLERGVDEVLCSVSYGKKSARGTEGLYTRAGFQFRGGMFAMNVRQ